VLREVIRSNARGLFTPNFLHPTCVRGRLEGAPFPVVTEHMRKHEGMTVGMRFAELIRPVGNRTHEHASGLDTNALSVRDITAARRNSNRHGTEAPVPVFI